MDSCRASRFWCHLWMAVFFLMSAGGPAAVPLACFADEAAAEDKAEKTEEKTSDAKTPAKAEQTKIERVVLSGT